jgi:hypothetical protein
VVSFFEERISMTAVRKQSADRYLKTKGNKISGQQRTIFHYPIIYEAEQISCFLTVAN